MKPEEGLYKKLWIKEVKEETEGFKTFVFKEGHTITYKSGQYLTFVAVLNGEEIRRSYSITSSPVLHESLSIGVKRIANGFFSRRFVDDLRPGDELTTIGAGGFFTLPVLMEAIGQIFFFAAGSGITPVYSLIKTTLYAHSHVSVVLVYSNASPPKTIFLSELLHLKEQFPHRFQIEFLFSDSPDLSKARLHRDLLISFVKKYSISKAEKILFYICGPQAYMRLCIYTLQEIGIDKQNIRKENFVIEPIKRTTAGPPDKNSHPIHLHIGEREYKFLVHYPHSILQAAKKNGISLPYSCEAGRCGNCMARCTKGQVWHSYNEVLTEKEINEGLILTCVGHPVGGEVILEIN